MKRTCAARAHRMPIPTPDGEFIARYSRKGLCGLEFPSGTKRRKSEAGAARSAAQVRRWHAAASKALRLALAGRPPKRLPPLDLSGGTEFQQRVWRALRRIASGPDVELRAGGAGDWQSEGRSCGGGRLRRQSDSRVCALPSGSGREQRSGWFLRRPELEARAAEA